MAKYVANPAWEREFRARVLRAGNARVEAMTKEAKALASSKSKRWGEQVAASPFRVTGPQSFRGGIGLTSWQKAWPGGLKERGTGQRTQKKTGRRTGAMPADPVFVPVAEKWHRVPFRF